MRAVVQRVTYSSVEVNGEIVGEINKGFNVLLGISKEDTEEDMKYIKDKIINLRVFSDENDKMNLSLLGISHRSDWFANVVVELEQRFLQLLNLSADEYKVLFLQGGATQQFAQIPYYFYDYNKQAKPEYIVSGYWSRLAFAEAQNIISNNHKIQN